MLAVVVQAVVCFHGAIGSHSGGGGHRGGGGAQMYAESIKAHTLKHGAPEHPLHANRDTYVQACSHNYLRAVVSWYQICTCFK